MFRRHSNQPSLFSNVIKRFQPAPPPPDSPPATSTITSRIQRFIHSLPIVSSDATPPSPSTTLVDPPRSQDMSPDTSGGVMMYSPLLPMNMDLVELAESVPYTGTDDQASLEDRAQGADTVAQGQQQGDKLGWLGARIGQGWSSFSLPWTTQTQSDAGPSFEATSPFPNAHSPLPNSNVIYSPFHPDHAQLPPVFSPLDLRSPLPNIYSPFPSSPQLPSSPGPQLVPLYLSESQATLASATEPPPRRRPRAWVPSRTKLSIQALWWGYRLYIPAPLMAHLSTRTLAAAHRAQVLTTALTWFLQNLPVHTLPAPAQPPLLLLQQLAPWAGYLGAALAWGWTRVEAFDEGYGIILTATWLVPFVLVPATWWETDFPLSPTMGDAGLPPEQAPPAYLHASHPGDGVAGMGDDRATESTREDQRGAGSGSAQASSSSPPPPYDVRSRGLSIAGSSASPSSPLAVTIPDPPSTYSLHTSVIPSSPHPSSHYIISPLELTLTSPPPTPSSPDQFFSAPSSPINTPPLLAPPLPPSFAAALSPLASPVSLPTHQDAYAHDAHVIAPLMHGRMPDTGVPPGSPLVDTLLRGPVLRSVPLPEVAVADTRRRRRKDGGSGRRSARREREGLDVG